MAVVISPNWCPALITNKTQATERWNKAANSIRNLSWGNCGRSGLQSSPFSTKSRHIHTGTGKQHLETRKLKTWHATLQLAEAASSAHGQELSPRCAPGPYPSVLAKFLSCPVQTGRDGVSCTWGQNTVSCPILITAVGGASYLPILQINKPSDFLRQWGSHSSFKLREYKPDSLNNQALLVWPL